MLNQFLVHLLQSNLHFCFWRYLIEHGAHVGAVNSEGELPLDVATEDAMERLLKAEIKKQGVDRPCILQQVDKSISNAIYDVVSWWIVSDSCQTFAGSCLSDMRICCFLCFMLL